MAVQATIWRDKKLVGCLHNCKVEPNDDGVVENIGTQHLTQKNKIVPSPPPVGALSAPSS